MKRIPLTLAVLLVGLASRPASAQSIGTYNPPTNPYAGQPISPYLNLLHGGNPGINYYGLVRPQMEAERYIQQQEIVALQKPGAQAATTTNPNATGHATRFMSYSQFFLTQGGPSATGGGAPTLTGNATAAPLLPTTRTGGR